MKKLMVFYKVAFALLGSAALIKQFSDTLRGGWGVVNFFSYFTIESNIFAVALLLLSASFTAQGKQSKTLGYLRGAATLYMVVTGIVYATLLSNGDGSGLAAWVNTVLHRLIPVVLPLDWLVDQARPAVRLKKALWWLVFPFVFVAYSLLRGQIVQWYPYPFLDPREQGYARVALATVGIAVGGLALIFLIVKYSQLQGISRKPQATRRQTARR